MCVVGTMHIVLIKGGVLSFRGRFVCVAGTMHIVLIKGAVLVSEVCKFVCVAGTMHSVS